MLRYLVSIVFGGGGVSINSMFFIASLHRFPVWALPRRGPPPRTTGFVASLVIAKSTAIDRASPGRAAIHLIIVRSLLSAYERLVKG